jgi:paraquat-inducible protein B
VSPPEEAPEASLRRGRFITWIWLIPITAAVIVLWLGWRTLAERGPLITITFETAEGLEAGNTKIRHKDVDIGTVESVDLTPDLSHVLVKARMNRLVAPHITAGARFWIVRPRLSPGGISGLGTLVSGSYIEMDPDSGEPASTFIGLEQPPVVQAAAPGRNFTLHADQLGSLSQSSPVYYHGIQVGQVLGYALAEGGKGVDVYVFVRSPYETLVHPESRFWNASGIEISAGAEGVHASTASLQALFAGGITFDTSPVALDGRPSDPGAEFRLYNHATAALDEPTGQKIVYLANFPGSVRGLSVGAPVDLQGIRIGEVTDVHLEYDVQSGRLRTPVTFQTEPDRMTLLGAPPSGNDFTPTVNQAFEHLIAQGLRAHLASGNLLTGQRLVSLEFMPGAPPATLNYTGPYPEVPTVPSGDLDSLSRSANQVMDRLANLPLPEIAQGLRNVIDHLDKLTGSPEVTRTTASLDRALTDLDRLMRSSDGQVPTLLDSLRRTADAATTTLDAANHALGGDIRRNGDVPALLRELTDAARSVRALADYLDQHPEALIRGRQQ